MLWGLFPDMPCMKMVYKDKKSVGTLVSNQERIAAVVPLINRLLTARQPVIVFPHRFTWDFLCPFSQKSRSGLLPSMPWRARWTVISWANRSVGVPNCLAPLRPATPPYAAPSRTADGMSGFWAQHQNAGCLRFQFKKYYISAPKLMRPKLQNAYFLHDKV